MTPHQLAAYGKKVRTQIGPVIKQICEKNDIFYGDFDSVLYRFIWAAPERIPELTNDLVHMLNVHFVGLQGDDIEELKRLLKNE